MTPTQAATYPGVLVVPAPIPDLPPIPPIPQDYYNSQSWLDWSKLYTDYDNAVELHKQIVTYLGYLSQWASNVPLWQVTKTPVPAPPTPPEGYPAAQILPAPPPAPPASPIGAPSSDGPNQYYGHGDDAPQGTRYTDPATGSVYVKIEHINSPFGARDRWLKIS